MPMPSYPSPAAGTAGAYRPPGSNQAAGYQAPYPPAYSGTAAGQPPQPAPASQTPYPAAAAYPQGFAPYPQTTPQTYPPQQTGKTFGLSPFPRCIVCLPVPVCAKMYHGFNYSFMQHRINICVHLAGTGTGRHVIMMHCGNGDMENYMSVQYTVCLLGR